MPGLALSSTDCQVERVGWEPNRSGAWRPQQPPDQGTGKAAQMRPLPERKTTRKKSKTNGESVSLGGQTAHAPAR